MSYFDFEGKSILETILGIIGIIFLFLFIVPFINFWLCYFGGWIASMIIGDQLVKAFSMIGFEISKDMLPWIAGLLGWIGGYFKEIKFNKN